MHGSHPTFIYYIIYIHIISIVQTMNQTHLLYIILAIVFMCFGLQMCFQPNQMEGFALSPASSPDATTYPILYKDYPVKTPGGISDMSSEDLWSYYPVFDNGFGQFTNNVRYWATPNNGRCSRAEMCGGLYTNKPIKDMRIVPVPKPISFNSEVRRVNFYGSEPMTCPQLPPQDVANCLYYGHKTNSLTPPYQPTLLDS